MPHRTSSRNVAHLWANRATFKGIAAAENSNGQFYYTGRTIWSYGRHFPVATLLEVTSPDSGRIETVAIFNSSSHSITTSKHQSFARSASHQFESHSFPLDCNLTDALERLSNGRQYDGDRETVQRIVQRRPESTACYPILLLTLQPQGVAGGESYAVRMARHRKAQTMLNKWRKAHAREKARTAKLMVARDLANIKAQIVQALKIPLADFKAQMPEWTKSIRQYGGKHGQKAGLSQYRAMHKAASSLGWNVRKVALWERIKIMTAAIEAAETFHAKANRLNYVRNRAKAFRIAISRHERGLMESAYDYREFANAARWLVQHAPGISRARPALLATIEAAENRAAEIDAARLAERHAAETAKRAAWLAGDKVSFHGTDENGRALLRIVGDELETSQGARVPLAHAVRVFHAVRFCRESGAAWQRNGRQIRVGHYQLDSIDEQGNFVAGCHRIGWNEVERLANTLGLFDQPMNEDAARAAVTVTENH